MSFNPTTNEAHNSSVEKRENRCLGDWLSALRQALKYSGQRALIVFEAESPDVDDAAYLEILKNSGCVISARSIQGIEAIAPGEAENLLGLEFDRVAYEFDDALDINVLCMLSGLVGAGGYLLVVTAGSSHQSYFQRWLLDRLANCDVFYRLADGFSLPQIQPLPESLPTSIEAGFSAEQRAVLAALHAWLEMDRNGVFLVTADRGRGKSTALGCFAQQVAARFSITVCAPSRRQAQVLLDRLGETSGVGYLAPDEFIRRRQTTDLLLIDEAAMIPGSMLWQCLELARHTVMATTTGGYEGTGQGFLLRFVAELESQKPLTRHTLEHPVRWGHNDLLEHALNHELMLGNGPVSEVLPGIDEPGIRLVNIEQLRSDARLLQGVYRLLVAAHYRTRPSDLARLLNDESQCLLVATIETHVVGVLLLNPEGGFDPELCEAVYLGARRPRGHLLAQMLTAQAGIRDFATFSGHRIQRIVVAPELRRRGIGRRLVQQAICCCRAEASSYLGSCFALDQTSVAFWQASGFDLVHIAAGQGTATARQTVAVLMALDESSALAIELLQQRIRAALPQWLLSYCRDIYWRDILDLLDYLQIRYTLDPLQQQEIHAFADGHRGFDYAQASLQRYLIGHLPQARYLDDGVRQLLIEKVLQNHSWGEVTARLGLPGRKTALKLIRQAIREIDEHG